MTWPMRILKESGGTAPNKVLRDKAFIAARNLRNLMDINNHLLQWFLYF